MRTFIARWARYSGLALVFLATTTGVAAARTVSPSADVTQADVDASNAKVQQAYGALATMWTNDLKQVGARFVVPGIARYRGNVRSACGIMPANNAIYCPQRNTIYYDDIFVARQAKMASNELGTDGDMAAVGIIAHEMGHAVAIQLRQDSPIPYENEAMADCLAGVFTRHSAADGTLEKGDLEEAFFGLAAAGDPTPQFTGDRRMDRRIATRAALMGHGTRDQRLANFRSGYDSGAGACIEGLR
jgi:predicted metalloprotease